MNATYRARNVAESLSTFLATAAAMNSLKSSSRPYLSAALTVLAVSFLPLARADRDCSIDELVLGG